MTDPEKQNRRTSDTVAIILASGVVIALNVVTLAILWAAYHRLGVDPDSGISENGTQLLTGAFGGIIVVLGSYLGFVYGRKSANGEWNGNGNTHEEGPGQEGLGEIRHQGSGEAPGPKGPLRSPLRRARPPRLPSPAGAGPIRSCGAATTAPTRCRGARPTTAP